MEESQKEIIKEDRNLTEIQKHRKIKNTNEFLNLGKLINGENIIEDNIQRGNTSDNFWYKKIIYVNKPYNLMTKTKLATAKNILYYIIIAIIIILQDSQLIIKNIQYVIQKSHMINQINNIYY